MVDSIYFSINMPKQGNSSDFEHMEQRVAVNIAVSAFVQVILGRRKLIWSGHPEIAVQIEQASKKFEVDDKSWITAYQPRMNSGNENGDMDSFYEVRDRMFSENVFSHAVFIGGSKKSLDEYKHFAKKQPGARILPITSTGGATFEIAKLSNSDSEEFMRKDDLIMMFYRRLGISVKEERLKVPPAQKTTSKPKKKLNIFYVPEDNQIAYPR